MTLQLLKHKIPVLGGHTSVSENCLPEVELQKPKSKVNTFRDFHRSLYSHFIKDGCQPAGFHDLVGTSVVMSVVLRSEVYYTASGVIHGGLCPVRKRSRNLQPPLPPRPPPSTAPVLTLAPAVIQYLAHHAKVTKEKMPMSPWDFCQGACLL